MWAAGPGLEKKKRSSPSINCRKGEPLEDKLRLGWAFGCFLEVFHNLAWIKSDQGSWGQQLKEPQLEKINSKGSPEKERKTEIWGAHLDLLLVLRLS